MPNLVVFECIMHVPGIVVKIVVIMASWYSDCHYYITSFNNVLTSVLERFKSCSRCIGDLRW